MTPEEKQAQMEQRNTDICLYYKEGHKLSECASKFRLSRQSIMQIVKKGGVWRPYVKTNRDKFLGVTVSGETKTALEERADEQGTSVSRFVSDHLDNLVKGEA
jgi:DNA-binding transcriptional regulator LsrR (DeoR family)